MTNFEFANGLCFCFCCQVESLDKYVAFHYFHFTARNQAIAASLCVTNLNKSLTSFQKCNGVL